MHKISACSFETLTEIKHTTEYHYRLQKKKPAVYLYPEPDKSYPLPISSGVTATSAYHKILCIESGIFILKFSTKSSTNFHSPPSVLHNLLTTLASNSLIWTLIIFGIKCKSRSSLCRSWRSAYCDSDKKINHMVDEEGAVLPTVSSSYVIATVTNVFCADAKGSWLLYSGPSQGSGTGQCVWGDTLLKLWGSGGLCCDVRLVIGKVRATLQAYTRNCRIFWTRTR